MALACTEATTEKEQEKEGAHHKRSRHTLRRVPVPKTVPPTPVSTPASTPATTPKTTPKKTTKTKREANIHPPMHQEALNVRYAVQKGVGETNKSDQEHTSEFVRRQVFAPSPWHQILGRNGSYTKDPKSGISCTANGKCKSIRHICYKGMCAMAELELSWKDASNKLQKSFVIVTKWAHDYIKFVAKNMEDEQIVPRGNVVDTKYHRECTRPFIHDKIEVTIGDKTLTLNNFAADRTKMRIFEKDNGKIVARCEAENTSHGRGLIGTWIVGFICRKSRNEFKPRKATSEEEWKTLLNEGPVFQDVANKKMPFVIVWNPMEKILERVYP